MKIFVKENLSVIPGIWEGDLPPIFLVILKHFGERVSLLKIPTFPRANKTVKIRVNNQEKWKVRVSRDYFQRCTIAASKWEIYMKDVLSHELAPVQLSMYHLDGEICKTKKLTLLKELEVAAESNIPPSSENSAYIIDLTATA